MNPAVYGSNFFLLGVYCLVHIVHAPAMLMDGGELVILGTVHHYHSLPFVRSFSILTVGVGSCLMAWEGPLYGTPPVWGFFFFPSPDRIYMVKHKSASPKNHRLSFLAEQICTRSGARFLLTRKIKKKKRFYLCGTQSTSCAMTQTGYTRANIREIHMRWQKINKMRVLFLFFIRNGIAVEATNM